MNINEIHEIEAAMQRKIGAMPGRIRPYTTECKELPRAISLTGPRGVGKTTFLLYHAQNRKILYFSADNPLLAGTPLYEVVRAIFMQGYEGVIVDEVHFAKEWSLHLKALYDDFPRHSIWVSDSSSLVMRSGTADLSRRFVNRQMPLLSFREFLSLETGESAPVYDPFSGQKELPLTPSPPLLDAFRRYKIIGSRPFYAEADFSERMLSVLDKTLYFDIPFFIPNVTDGNLRLMKAVTATLASAAIPRLQVRSLCADWGVGADRLYQILEVMQSVGILRIIRRENDTKAKSAGDKLFFSDFAFYHTLHGNTGSAREATVAALCAGAGWQIESTRDERSGDFVITKEGRKLRLEVGGASKKVKNADFVIRDDTDYPSSGVIPLWLLGMGY